MKNKKKQVIQNEPLTKCQWCGKEKSKVNSSKSVWSEVLISVLTALTPNTQTFAQRLIKLRQY